MPEIDCGEPCEASDSCPSWTEFGSVRKCDKGLPVADLFHQALCFFFDGTSRHLVHFDALRQDDGYAGAIEMKPERMASSHTMKRFFCAFPGPQNWGFRRVLQQLFLWRLKRDQPTVVILGIEFARPDTVLVTNLGRGEAIDTLLRDRLSRLRGAR